MMSSPVKKRARHDETEEQRESRLQKRCEAYKRRRDLETEEQRQQRLLHRRQQRASETPDQWRPD